MNKEIIIILKPLFFYSHLEEKIFYNLLNNIICILHIEKIDSGFKIKINTEIINNKPTIFFKEFDILNSIFKRYKLDNINQMKMLKTQSAIIIAAEKTILYTKEDQEIFLNWTTKIKSSFDIHWSGEEITFNFYNLNLPEEDLKNIAAIFVRYNLKRTLYKLFDFPRKKDNAIIFKKIKQYQKKPYQITYPIIKNYTPSLNSLVFDPLKFYTKDDEELFFQYIKKISCISKIDYVGRKIYLQIIPQEVIDNKLVLFENDFINLKILFWRYNPRNWNQPYEKLISIKNPEKKEINNIKYNIRLSIDTVRYCSKSDENMFFEWIKNIKSILYMEDYISILYFNFDCADISNEDLINLIGLFKRYEIQNSVQLKIFMTEQNKYIFEKYDILNYIPPKKDLP